MENAPEGTLVAHVRVHDPDSGANGLVGGVNFSNRLLYEFEVILMDQSKCILCVISFNTFTLLFHNVLLVDYIELVK